MKKVFHTFAMALLAGIGTALAQDDIILEDGVFMDDTGMDPIFSTPSTLPSAPAAEGESARPVLVPNDYYFEYMGRMHIHGQGQHARIMNAFATIPLINGRKHAWHGWHLDCKLSGRISWLHNSGTRVLDESRLYTLGLSATALLAVVDADGVRGVQVHHAAVAQVDAWHAVRGGGHDEGVVEADLRGAG